MIIGYEKVVTNNCYSERYEDSFSISGDIINNVDIIEQSQYAFETEIVFGGIPASLIL